MNKILAPLGKYRKEEVFTESGNRIIYTNLNSPFSLEVAEKGKGINTISFSRTPFGNIMISDSRGWSHKDIENALLKMLRESYFSSSEEIVEEKMTPFQFSWEEEFWKRSDEDRNSDGTVNISLDENLIPMVDGSYLLFYEYEEKPKPLELKRKNRITFSLKLEEGVSEANLKEILEKWNEETVVLLRKYITDVAKVNIIIKLKETTED